MGVLWYFALHPTGVYNDGKVIVEERFFGEVEPGQ